MALSKLTELSSSDTATLLFSFFSTAFFEAHEQILSANNFWSLHLIFTQSLISSLVFIKVISFFKKTDFPDEGDPIIKNISTKDGYEASKEDLKYFKHAFEKILFDKNFLNIFDLKKIKEFIIEIS